MNNYLFIDAVSYLDADLLASHLERKDKLRNKLKSAIYLLTAFT